MSAASTWLKIVEPDEAGAEAPRRGKRQAPKGRAFSALSLAQVQADGLWESGSGDNVRPVFLLLAGSEGQIRPFVMNLRCGRKAEVQVGGRTPPKVEIMRSAGYEYPAMQRTPHGVLQAIYLPELFNLDPGMIDPRGVKFILMPPTAQLRAMAQEIAAGPDAAQVLAHARALGLQGDVPGRACDVTDIRVALSDAEIFETTALAAQFCARLDRRTRCPVIPRLDYQLQLFCAVLALKGGGVAHTGQYGAGGRERWGWATHDGQNWFTSAGVDDVGLARPIMCNVSHADLDRLLADQVRLYFELTGARD